MSEHKINLSAHESQVSKVKKQQITSTMERRKQNWGTLMFSSRSTTRRNPLFRSSPNLSTTASSRVLLGDDDDDYGFITRPFDRNQPPPPIPPVPLEFQEEYQKRLKELQNKVYWESIKRQLTEYYSHHHEARQHQRMSDIRGSSCEDINKPMETVTGGTYNITNKFLKNKQNSAAQAVPLQSSSGLDDYWISGSNRRDSGSTSELLDQVCEVQDCCERFEDFKDVEDLRSSEKVTPLCVKCLVRYYNTRPTVSNMSRVSDIF